MNVYICVFIIISVYVVTFGTREEGRLTRACMSKLIITALFYIYILINKRLNDNMTTSYRLHYMHTAHYHHTVYWSIGPAGRRPLRAACREQSRAGPLT